MRAGKVAELALRAVAFSMLCGILAYVMFVLSMFVVAFVQIAIFIFFVMGSG